MTTQEFISRIGEILDVQDPLTGQESLSSFSGWDSMATIMFIALVDEELGVTLEAEKIYEAQTVNDLKLLVADHLEG